MMKRLMMLGAFVLLSQATLAARADSIQLCVNLSNAEVSSLLTATEDYQALATYLSGAIGMPIKLVVGQNATTELQRTRTGYYGIIFGPSHVIGSAIRYGYEPVAKMPGSTKAVFIASKASGARTLDQFKGLRLTLPSQDSLTTYLAKGELNASGIQLKTFAGISYSRYQNSALYSLAMGQTDVVAVSDDEARKWLEKNPGTVIQETAAAPNPSVAVNGKFSSALQGKIRAALLQLSDGSHGAILSRLHVTGFEPAKREDFQYVSTLGYFTPKVLAGATVVNADEAKELMAKGTPFFDTRVEHEYNESHIKGAIGVTYKEASPKDVDFDATQDSFDLSRLPKDKNQAIILACNGPECWKSYKGAVLALRNGHKKVYWFRNGFPEWKARGYPLE